MRIVITYGTFDCFHYGHYNLLKRAKDIGDYLIVGVSSDFMCEKKGKIPMFDEKYRMEVVSNLRFVDEVILEESMEQKVSDVIKKHVDVFVLGDDYKELFPKMKECNQLIELGCQIIFLERTPDISSSSLREKKAKQALLDENKNSIHNLTKGNK